MKLNSVCSLFKFHIGAIKRLNGLPPYPPTEGFKFHIGAIKSRNPLQAVLVDPKFKFHIGAIKRIGNILLNRRSRRV